MSNPSEPVPGQAPDGPPPMVAAMRWVSQITTISLEMALPAGMALFLGAPIWVVLLCAVLGFAVATWHLVQMVAVTGRPGPRGTVDGEDEAGSP